MRPRVTDVTAPESLIDEEVIALKVAAVLDHVLAKLPDALRSILPMIVPVFDSDHLHLWCGSAPLVSIPIWWLRDGDDWLLPSLNKGA